MKKSDFCKSKKLFKIDDIDVGKIIVSKKGPYDTCKSIQYFIGYNENYETRPLCIMLPQMIGYAKCFKNNNNNNDNNNNSDNNSSCKVTDKKTITKVEH